MSQYGLEIEILTKFTDRSRNFQRHENLLLKFGIVAEQRTDEKFFFKVARGAFSQRRKTLSNSVSSSMGIDKSIVNQAIEQSDLPASVRPEALSMEQFITFSETLRKLI